MEEELRRMGVHNWRKVATERERGLEANGGGSQGSLRPVELWKKKMCIHKHTYGYLYVYYKHIYAIL